MIELPANRETLVIGIGNDDRGDDAIGLWVARRLRERCISGLTVRESTGDPIRLLDAWRDADRVIIVDALLSASLPGTVLRFEVTRDSLGAGMARFSSHGGSLRDAVELGRALSRLPRQLVIVGIEGKNFDYGAFPSAEVLQGARSAMDLILRELSASETELPACRTER